MLLSVNLPGAIRPLCHLSSFLSELKHLLLSFTFILKFHSETFTTENYAFRVHFVSCSKGTNFLFLAGSGSKMSILWP